MIGYTVVWQSAARAELARLWLDNPRVRQEITDASDRCDLQLAIRPLDIGVETSLGARQYVEPPLSVLYRVVEADRIVRVIYVKFWTD